MAEDATPALPAQLNQLELGAIGRIPAVRQLLLLIGVAAAVAGGSAAFLWSQGPDMRPVYQGLNGADVAEVIAALESAGVTTDVTSDGAGVMVPNAELAQARLTLAGQGLPGGAHDGMSRFGEQSTFGASQFMESARYQHALEAELSRTIGSIRAVQDARVHLAVPRQTTFLRSRDKPSASVLLTLHRGQRLEPGQAQSIVNLVAASVPNLTASAVTVVDQQGTLLSDRDTSTRSGMHAYQFDATRQLESVYRERIMELLAPVVGAQRVRAEVVADLDFTMVEQTSESFDPARSTVRSEALNESVRTAIGPDGEGIPGALSNQPVAAGGVANAVAAADENTPLDRQSSTTRNFEIDKTVSVTRQPTGSIRRLNVAVLIDNTPIPVPLPEDAEEGELPPDPVPVVTEEQLEQLRTLVREAIGFDEVRGDRVSVVATQFLATDPVPEIEPLPIWQQPDIVALARSVLGILVVIGIAFGIGRPFLKGLLATTHSPEEKEPGVVAATGEVLPAGAPLPEETNLPSVPGFSYDEKIAAVRNITNHDPARVALVLKKWLASDE